MTFVMDLIVGTAALAGAAAGSLLTIVHYNDAARRRAAYEEELVESRDLLAAMALLRRVQVDERPWP